MGRNMTGLKHQDGAFSRPESAARRASQADPMQLWIVIGQRDSQSAEKVNAATMTIKSSAGTDIEAQAGTTTTATVTTRARAHVRRDPSEEASSGTRVRAEEKGPDKLGKKHGEQQPRGRKRVVAPTQAKRGTVSQAGRRNAGVVTHMPADVEHRSAPTPELDPLAVAKAYIQGASGPTSDPSSVSAMPRKVPSEVLFGTTGPEGAPAEDKAVGRPLPTLRSHADGSYSWRGYAVTARIGPDGVARFTNRPVVELDLLPGVSAPARQLPEPESPAARIAGSRAPLAVLRFDLFDLAERLAGRDPYIAEKMWFLERTEELRKRMADEYRRWHRKRRD